MILLFLISSDALKLVNFNVHSMMNNESCNTCSVSQHCCSLTFRVWLPTLTPFSKVLDGAQCSRPSTEMCRVKLCRGTMWEEL